MEVQTHEEPCQLVEQCIEVGASFLSDLEVTRFLSSSYTPTLESPVELGSERHIDVAYRSCVCVPRCAKG